MRRLGTAAALVLAYGVALVVLTWPWAAHFATHVPDTVPSCRCDTPYMAWVLAHESRWLARGGGAFTDLNAFFPERHTLFYGDTGFGVLPVFLPVFLATGNPTLAIDVVLLLGLALTAASLHLVVRAWTASHAAGVVAAATFLASAWTLRLFVPSAPAYAWLAYLPAIVWLAATPARRFGEALRLLPLVVLQALSDVVYLASATIVPLAVLAVGRMLRPATRAAGVRLAGVLGLAVLALVPVYAGHLAVRATPGLESPWHPLQLSALPWLPFRLGPLAVPVVVWLVIAAGVLARLGRRDDDVARRAWLHATLWAVVGFLISLNPHFVWGASPRVLTVPYLALPERLGLYDVLRMPERTGLAALVGVAMLAGLGFAAVVARLPVRLRGLAVVVLVAAMVASHARALPAGIGAYPLWAPPGPDTPLVAALRAGSGPVLELPVGRPGLGAVVQAEPQMAAAYRGLFHGRPVVNGYSSYWPVAFRERMERAAALPDPDALAALRASTGVTAVVVRLAELPPASQAPWLALEAARRGDGLTFVLRDGSDLLFAVGDGA